MKIPENQKPYRVIINGVETVYEAGSEQDVPESVAQVIDNGESFPPAAADPVSPFPVPESGSKLPDVTSDDNGKLLGVADGVWDKVNAPKELPAVTNTDNGKVLRVKNGAWDKVFLLELVPTPSSGDVGKVLTVVNGIGGYNWSSPGGAEEFIITCIPTAEDMSGTMDKTPSEIKAAYEAGKNIRIRVVTDVDEGGNVTNYSELPPESYDVVVEDGEVLAIRIAATFIYGFSGVAFLVQAVTSSDSSTYSTTLFPLTPYSP